MKRAGGKCVAQRLEGQPKIKNGPELCPNRFAARTNAFYITDNNSISNINVEFGGMGPMPREP